MQVERVEHVKQVEQVNWVDIPAGLLRRGTPVDEVPAVARRYADTGVPVEWYLKEAPRAEVHVPAFRVARILRSSQ